MIIRCYSENCETDNILRSYQQKAKKEIFDSWGKKSILRIGFLLPFSFLYLFSVFFRKTILRVDIRLCRKNMTMHSDMGILIILSTNLNNTTRKC